jgi:hypothetical protein
MICFIDSHPVRLGDSLDSFVVAAKAINVIAVIGFAANPNAGV